MMGDQKHSLSEHPPPCALLHSAVKRVGLQLWGAWGAGARRGHDTAQVSDVTSVKERRARYVGWVVLTCSSAVLYNLSSVGCLSSCFLSSGVLWDVSIGNRLPTPFLCICLSGENVVVYRSECIETPFWSSCKTQYFYVCMLHIGTCLPLTLRWNISYFHILGRGLGRMSILSAILHSQPSVVGDLPSSVNVNFIALKWTAAELVLCFVSCFSPLRITVSGVIRSM